jgi:hypothetical protein
LTGGIGFVNFNSPFTDYLPNQVLQAESVATKLDFGLPGSVGGLVIARPLLMRLVESDSELEHDCSALAGFRSKIYLPEVGTFA